MNEPDRTLEELAGRSIPDGTDGTSRLGYIAGVLTRHRFNTALGAAQGKARNDLARARLLARARALPDSREKRSWWPSAGAGLSGLAAGVLGAFLWFGQAAPDAGFNAITSASGPLTEQDVKSIGDGPAISYRIGTRDVAATAESFARALAAGRASFVVRFDGDQSALFTVRPLERIPAPLEAAARDMNIVIPVDATLRVEFVRE